DQGAELTQPAVDQSGPPGPALRRRLPAVHRLLPQPSTPPQCTENPPSTNSECPVTYPDAAPARNTAAPAKSSGTPLRPTVVRAASAAMVSASSWRRWLRGVSTKPGTSVFAVTPRADHASDCERASDSRPPLETP